MSQTTFESLELSQQVLQAIRTCGFESPTEIQAKSIPLIMNGQDVVGRSNTGTGKTAAFAIPAIEQLDPALKQVQVLVLSPTRELALQSKEEFDRFSKFVKGITSVCIYGGAPIDRQITALKRGAQVVIGTPGRLMDHLRRRTLSLEQVRLVVLDEADEMLDMGFREDIETILSQTPAQRQTVLFSATMPPEIRRITRQYQNNPEFVEIQSKYKTVDSIEQYYYNVPVGRKADALHLLLYYYMPACSIIFCNTKAMVEVLAEDLSRHGFSAVGLHGDLKQAQRNQVMGSFKANHSKILVATDVAARGIDVENVDCVINFDIPQNTEYYIHRIGRTGRAGKEGTSFTLLSGREQERLLVEIMHSTGAHIMPGLVPTPDQITQKRMQRLMGAIQEELEQTDSVLPEYAQLVEQFAQEGRDLSQLCAVLLQRIAKERRITISPVATRKLWVEQTKKPNQQNSRGGAASAWVRLSIGRRQKAAPNYILGSIRQHTGLDANEVGKIEVSDQSTLVEVPKAKQAQVVKELNGRRILGNRVEVSLFEKKPSRSGGRPGAPRRGGNGSRRPNTTSR